ncbi:tyrosine-type recombinase/integrase [Seohaeicola sp. SP36]|uniref:site-specific integrase n=1 Tax=unclassified Seohaeicola TaxID=2641111 RepID=UPI00237B99A5|nr:MULTISPECIES: tyrosine-type recombinase/integrase [unclassified Seohaeicola]MDD9708771.1 tyrosine-type recombinase/integrase [Seohaeicola sp. 4SK31]MDD9734938.1 tyrosine-type recombinase/integrase [Seohaeicola sp. SP36]
MIGADRTTAGSADALVAMFYRSPEYLGLADSTKRVYRGTIEPFRLKYKHLPIKLLERRHIQKMLAEKADTPHAANNLRKRLIQLLDHAVSLDWRPDNPARATKPYKIGGTGFHSWDEGEIARFFEVHKPGTMAHRAVTLILYTGAARVDVVKLGPWNIKGDRLEYRRQKTARSGGVLVSIPIHRDLAAVLATLPDDRPFLATLAGKPRSAEGFGNAMRSWCDEAGLEECAAHGLRKACARRLAEAGATAHEIGAVTGHKTLALIQLYTEAAGREGLADSAMGKLIARPNSEQNVVNLPKRFATKTRNPLKNKE